MISVLCRPLTHNEASLRSHFFLYFKEGSFFINGSLFLPWDHLFNFQRSFMKLKVPNMLCLASTGCAIFLSYLILILTSFVLDLLEIACNEIQIIIQMIHNGDPYL